MYNTGSSPLVAQTRYRREHTNTQNRKDPHNGNVTGLLLSNEKYNRRLAVDRQALGLGEASRDPEIER